MRCKSQMIPRVLWYCYKLSRNQWLEPSELEILQEKKLKAIIRHAYENVPLYRGKFDSAGVKPDDIKTLKDIEKLPFVTKQEIRSNMPDKSTARGYETNDCVKMSTSGTTGGPMTVYCDKRCWDNEIVDWYYRTANILDYNTWDTCLTISYATPTRDIHSNEGEIRSQPKHESSGRAALGFLTPMFGRWRKNLFIAYNADEIVADVVKYQPRVIKGNTSYLRLLAEAIASKGCKEIEPKALLSWGEVLDNPNRNFLESFFGCKVYDVYGANEIGSIATECGKRSGLHVKADMVILEVLKNGKPAAAGECGEIVVTGLLNYAMPLIRYRVGDIGILGDEQCPCGRGFPLLRSVEGRIVDCLQLPNGRLVTPKTIATAVQGTPGVSRYQVVQESMNKIKIDLMSGKKDPNVG